MYTTYVYSDYITLKSSCCVCISITSTSMARPGGFPHMSTPGFQTPTSRGSNTHWACVCENHPLGPWRWVFCLEILWWKDSPAKVFRAETCKLPFQDGPGFFFQLQCVSSYNRFHTSRFGVQNTYGFTLSRSIEALPSLPRIHLARACFICIICTHLSYVFIYMI